MFVWPSSLYADFVTQIEEEQSGHITVKFAFLETLPDPNPIIVLREHRLMFSSRLAL